MTQYHFDLVAPYNPVRVESFAELPEWARNPVWRYMEEGGLDNIEEWLRFFFFVYAQIPTEVMKDAILWSVNKENEGYEQFKDFDEYHQWYISSGHMPNHGDSRWACILSEFPDEVIADGSHRFHYYITQGDEKINVVGLIHSNFS